MLVDVARTPHAIVHPVGAVMIHVEVLDGLLVSIDGSELLDVSWQRRRKARIALALLVASDGVIERDALIDALWPNEPLDHITSQSRLSTVLSALRRALPGTKTALEPGVRGLKLHGRGVELRLGLDDTTDLGLLRAAMARRAADPPPSRDAWFAHARAIAPYVAGEPLRGIDASILLEELRERLARELAAACFDAIDGWRSARRPGEPSLPPRLLLELADHAARLQPLDEPIAALVMELYADAGRPSDATRAFHRYRADLDPELGLVPGPGLVRRHARIVELA
jgi:DNA-binding SARP family transcriptional activator